MLYLSVTMSSMGRFAPFLKDDKLDDEDVEFVMLCEDGG